MKLIIQKTIQTHIDRKSRANALLIISVLNLILMSVMRFRYRTTLRQMTLVDLEIKPQGHSIIYFFAVDLYCVFFQFDIAMLCYVQNGNI